MANDQAALRILGAFEPVMPLRFSYFSYLQSISFVH